MHVELAEEIGVSFVGRKGEGGEAAQQSGGVVVRATIAINEDAVTPIPSSNVAVSASLGRRSRR